MGNRAMGEQGRERAKEVILSILMEYMIALSTKEILIQIKTRNLRGYGRMEWGARRIGGFLRQLKKEDKVERIGTPDKYKWRITEYGLSSRM